MPIAVATELISYGKASEMDVVLDLWLSAIYKDNQVRGSEVGPVVYLRNGTGNPLLNYSDLAQRWGLSRSTVGRLLKKLADLEYLTLMSFPGRTGSVIYLNSYLSTMFQVSDVMVDKDEVAMSLNIKLHIPEDADTAENSAFQTSSLAFQNRRWSALSKKWRKSLRRKGFPAFTAPNPLLSYIPYPATARKQ